MPLDFLIMRSDWNLIICVTILSLNRFGTKVILNIINEISQSATQLKDIADQTIPCLSWSRLWQWITPADFISDPHKLTIQLWVNDELMQNASSRQMYFTIPEQIEYLSELMTLLPGDVITTGTPAGVGHPRGLYLKPGDTVKITIEGLGSIRNPVIAGFGAGP